MRSLLLLLGFAIVLAGMSTPSMATEESSGSTATATTSIPFKKDEREVGSNLPNVVAALVAVAVIGWGVVYALRRANLLPTGLVAKPRRVKLLETTRLDARVMLYTISADGKTLLLGRCGDSLIVVAELQGGASAADDHAAGKS